MKAISGAIIILAGAILFGAGAIAESIITAASTYSAAGRSAMVGGGIVGVVGILVLVARERPPFEPR